MLELYDKNFKIEVTDTYIRFRAFAPFSSQSTVKRIKRISSFNGNLPDIIAASAVVPDDNVD